MSDSAQTFADLVREERRRRHLTQEDVAEIVGVSMRTVKNWEAGLHRPYGFLARCVAEAFELSTEELLELCERER